MWYNIPLAPFGHAHSQRQRGIARVSSPPLMIFFGCYYLVSSAIKRSNCWLPVVCPRREFPLARKPFCALAEGGRRMSVQQYGYPSLAIAAHFHKSAVLIAFLFPLFSWSMLLARCAWFALVDSR